MLISAQEAGGKRLKSWARAVNSSHSCDSEERVCGGFGYSIPFSVLSPKGDKRAWAKHWVSRVSLVDHGLAVDASSWSHVSLSQSGDRRLR